MVTIHCWDCLYCVELPRHCRPGTRSRLTQSQWHNHGPGHNTPLLAAAVECCCTPLRGSPHVGTARSHHNNTHPTRHNTDIQKKVSIQMSSYLVCLQNHPTLQNINSLCPWWSYCLIHQVFHFPRNTRQGWNIENIYKYTFLVWRRNFSGRTNETLKVGIRIR